MLFPIIRVLRAARRIGVAARKQKSGDFAGVLGVCSEALELLGAPGVNLEMPWCRSAASQALWGYCRAARELGRMKDLHETLERWRPTYLAWIGSPLSEQEAEYLQWFEQVFSSRSGAS